MNYAVHEWNTYSCLNDHIMGTLREIIEGQITRHIQLHPVIMNINDQMITILPFHWEPD